MLSVGSLYPNIFFFLCYRYMPALQASFCVAIRDELAFFFRIVSIICCWYFFIFNVFFSLSLAPVLTPSAYSSSVHKSSKFARSQLFQLLVSCNRWLCWQMLQDRTVSRCWVSVTTLHWPLYVESMWRTLQFEASVVVSMATLKVALHRLWQVRKWSLLGDCDFNVWKDEVKY